MPEYTIHVTGMVCSNCERTVCRTVAELGDVSSVSADADADRVTVECPPDARETVCQYISSLGFEVEG